MKKYLKFCIQFLLTPLPSLLKVPVYRLLGAKIGRDTKISAFTVLISDHIVIEPGARIKIFTLIFGLHKFELGAYATISNFCIINGDNYFFLGARGYIAPFCIIDVRDNVIISECSGLGPRSTIMTHGVFLPASWGYTAKFAPVKLGKLVWVAFNCKIGPGVTINDDVFILPNSGVCTDIKNKGVIYDQADARKTFPICMVRKKITKSYILSFLKNIITNFVKDKLHNWQVDFDQDVCLISSSKKNYSVLISFFGWNKNIKNERQYSECWLFGFDIKDEEIALLSTENIQFLDFRWILYSSNVSRLLKKAINYFRSHDGLRFANVVYRDHFKIDPPALN